MTKRIACTIVCLVLAAQCIEAADSLGVSLLGRFTATSPEDIVVVGDRAYIANSSGGLQVLDVSNPAAIAELGYLFLPGKATGVCILGDYIGVACSDSAFRILNASNPSAISVVGTFRSSSAVYRCEARGDTVFTNGGKFLVIDASTPASPTLIGEFASVFDYSRFAVQGETAYLAEKNYGLSIVDLENPASPSARGRRFALEQYIRGVCADRFGKIYIAANSGVFVMRWQGDTLAQIGFHSTSAPVHDIFVDGGFAFIACGASGLRILDIAEPSTITEVGFYNLGSECTDLFHSYPIAWLSGLWARINAMNIGSFSEIAEAVETPRSFEVVLLPNPFNSSLTISAAEPFVAEIFDISGRVVHRASSGEDGTFIWQPNPQTESGIYLVKTSFANGGATLRRAVLLK